MATSPRVEVRAIALEHGAALATDDEGENVLCAYVYPPDEAYRAHPLRISGGTTTPVRTGMLLRLPRGVTHLTPITARELLARGGVIVGHYRTESGELMLLVLNTAGTPLTIDTGDRLGYPMYAHTVEGTII